MYEGTLSEYSDLEQTYCLNLETVIEDLNRQVEVLYSHTNVSQLSTDNCLVYATQDGEVTAKTAILRHNIAIKDIMQFIGLDCDGGSATCPAIFTQDLTCLNLDFGVLTDPCGSQPTTLKDVLQLILNHIQP
jgi:hypothetical protein